MQGQMMDFSLDTQAILRRGGQIFGNQQVVTRLTDGSYHRYTLKEFERRVHRLINALRDLGIQPGDRVGTLCWNHYRHLELYFAISSMGAVLHTLNIRLSEEQLSYIINHAEDQVIFVDSSLTGVLEAVQDQCGGVRNYVVIDEADKLPETTLPEPLEYESLLAAVSDQAELPPLDENSAAAMCYTSGTTGNPKGVVYSHRSIYLHTMAVMTTDGYGLSQREVVLPFVPMFHANAWGLPYAALYSGCRLVLPGEQPNAATLATMMNDEGVTTGAGVPAIWNMLYQHLKQENLKLDTVETLIVGGSAAPRAMIEKFDKEFDVAILHLWGMTEMSPLGTVGRIRSHMEEWSYDDQLSVRMKQGVPAAGVEIRIQDDAGQLLPWDGQTIGELTVRGPWVASGYYNNPEASKAFTADGWFRTGDMVTVDEEGYMQIADRSKDLIKSGGEWISSVDMENTIMAHPSVLEAAVVARPDDKWDERPVAFVVPADAATAPTEEQIRTYLLETFAKWQVPGVEDIRFIDAVPKTSVGKFDKKVLRQQWDTP
ncbi:MAG: long-chain fatty acid--CoA ligase [Gammaproteobacteria bacterium]